MDYIEHRKKAAELFTEARALVDKQDATEAELTRAHELTLQAEALQARADKAEADGISAIREDASGIATVADLSEIRTYGPGERMGRGEPAKLGRLLRGMITGDWSGVSEEHRQMGTTPGADGGFITPIGVSMDYVDLARAQSVCMQAGVRSFPIETTTITIPIVATDPGVGFVQENALIPFDEPTLDAIELAPYKLAGLCRLSKELASDSPAAMGLVENTLSKAMALALDQAILNGTGVAEPLGIIPQVPPAQQIDLAAAPLAGYAEISQACQMIYELNGGSNLAMIASPHIYGTVDRLVGAVEGQPLQGPESWKGLRKLMTTSMPDDTVIIGDFSQIYLAMRLPLIIEVSAESGDSFQRYQLRVRSVLRADCAPVRMHFALLINVG